MKPLALSLAYLPSTERSTGCSTGSCLIPAWVLLEEIEMLKKKVELAEMKVHSSEGKFSYSGKKIAKL